MDGLASRIGSDYSDDCDIVQVTLNKGESVFILERRETPENPASPVWLKIAPPSGEFRWIHKSALSSPIQQVRYDAEGLQIPLQIQQLQSILSDDAMTVHVPELPKVASSQQSVHTSAPKIASAIPLSTIQSPVSNAIADPFQRAFSELQREAHVVMTRPVDDEVFGILIHRAAELHQIAPTDHDLEKTYHLLESLQRTRAVRQQLALRRPQTTGMPRNLSALNSRTSIRPPAAANARISPPLQSTAPLSLTPAVTANSTGVSPLQSVIPAYIPTSAQNRSLPLQAGVNVGGFDIVGRLGEFYPLPKGHPPYAVVDEKGQIICLISPSSNLELSSHVGQFVGINGILGFYERPNKPPSRHITAQSIRELR
jgi:hypothetical protein